MLKMNSWWCWLTILLLVNSSVCVMRRAFNKVIYWCLPHILWSVDCNWGIVNTWWDTYNNKGCTIVDREPHPAAGITVLQVTDWHLHSCSGVRHTRPPARSHHPEREQGSYKGAGVIWQQHKQKWKNKLEQFFQSFPDQISIGTMANAFKMSFLICPLQK